MDWYNKVYFTFDYWGYSVSIFFFNKKFTTTQQKSYLVFNRDIWVFSRQPLLQEQRLSSL